MNSYALEHAWLIPLLPAVAFLLCGTLFRRVPHIAAGVAILASLASFVLALGVAGGVIAQNITVAEPLLYRAAWFTVPGLTVDMGVYIDPLTAMMLFVVTLVSLMVQIYSLGYMAGDPGFSRFYAFLSLFAASMLGLVIAVNFVQMYVFWELVGLCSYLLIGYYFHKVSAREAAKKAFMTTRIGDFGLLLGILLLQILFGTLDFAKLGVAIPAYVAEHGTALLTMVAVLIFIGPVGKSGQFPLHVWLPDAMEGPTPVSALIHAATMVVAGVYLIARSYTLFHALPGVLGLIAWVGGFTALFAAVIAVTQREIKRILAYSTISQLGYMMLALGVGSLTASMFHLMTHAFFKALMFLAAGSVLHALHDKADIFEMGGLRKQMPLTFAAMGIGVVAIAGIPPFAGFYSKDEILAAAYAVSMPLYVIALVTAFLTAFYMARLLFVAFFGSPRSSFQAHESGPAMVFPLVVLGLLSVVGGYIPHATGFGHWIYFGETHAEPVNLVVAVSSVVAAVAAIALSWSIYGAGTIQPAVLKAKFGVLYRLSYHKFYVDELYAWINQKLVDGLGKMLAWIDVHIVDGFVNLLAWLTKGSGDLLRRLQTGQVQHYALVFFGAAVIALLWFTYGGHSLAMAALLGGQ
ncbi:putative membrane protein [Propionispora sp. 2/2-37]|uniref:NADH-quinone oxidoreductase subunit L n=1 Tax=Propionispora sp. 2/2-37 TaxID=1677858 RepID=UPI0006BB5C34|nr:NADH-quinone oxidoreductase subunit L [Propionispora sp. 2/2-37]CUH94768.1 putative membrane protein [Propionispora sp. 2/2-37]